MPEGKGWLAAPHYCQFLRAVPCVFCSKDRREQLDDARDLPPLLSDTPAPPSLSKKRMNWRLLLLLAAIFLALLVTLFNILTPPQARANGANQQQQQWQKAFMGAVNNASIRNHLFQLTKEPHVAGTPEDFATADYVFQRFQEYGLAVHYTDYDVLLSYPLHRSLILTAGPIQEPPLELSLKEEPVQGDLYSQNPKVIPTFHGYAPSGNVSGEVVYANYGRLEDFQKLAAMGIDVKGAIVLARYHAIYRGDIVENAANAGAVAAIIYSDPQDYAANYTQEVYPHSQWLPPSGIQRGTVSQGVGDPLTPGWPSTPKAERISASDPEAMLPTIPSLPISAEDAKPILASLGGPVSPAEWHGALDLPQYRLGRGPGVLNLSFIVSLSPPLCSSSVQCL
jgi:N-acetylated-alpha-linked acidic dipeptidase